MDIPIDKYGKSHLFFSFRHCSSNDSKDKLDKNFAFGFVNLVEADGTVLSDSLHNLTIYQWDKKLCSNASYLTESDPKKLIPTKDTFSFKSALFSTKLTQKKELLSVKFLSFSFFFQFKKKKKEKNENENEILVIKMEKFNWK